MHEIVKKLADRRSAWPLCLLMGREYTAKPGFYSWSKLVRGFLAHAIDTDILNTAVESVIEREHEFGSFSHHFECCVEEWQAVLEALGFSDVQISWSGFSSQGDGASFTGRLSEPEKLLRWLVEATPDIDEASSKFRVLAGKYTEYKPLLKLLPLDDICAGRVTRGGWHYCHANTITWEPFNADEYVFEDLVKNRHGLVGRQYPALQNLLNKFHQMMANFVRLTSNLIYDDLQQVDNWTYTDDAVSDRLYDYKFYLRINAHGKLSLNPKSTTPGD